MAKRKDYTLLILPKNHFGERSKWRTCRRSRKLFPRGFQAKAQEFVFNFFMIFGFVGGTTTPPWVHCALCHFPIIFLFIIIYKYVILILYFRKDVFLLAREKSTVEYQNVTVRIPKRALRFV